MNERNTLRLCILCKSGVPFEVELVNSNFETVKCDVCKKKKPCQTFRIIGRGERNGKA